ncbi:aspartate/glutamate racemase family protein [Thalassotalea sp. G20_0]|nr:aspartate/glutamate racemase family protein [Thalassotalea sp. G20_0]
MLGILGGMGPLATVDFMQKVIALSLANSDQEHLPMLVHNVPQIPDRSACILHGWSVPGFGGSRPATGDDCDLQH